MNSKYEQALLEKRIIPIERVIDDAYATAKIQQLLDLSDYSNEDIYLFINNPGGYVTACFALYDTIRWCSCDVNTVCCRGTAAFATLLLAAGSRGKRFAFQDSVIIPTLFTRGKAPEFIYADAVDLSVVTDKTVQTFARLTGNTTETMRAVCTANHRLGAEDAKKYGFIDKVIGSQIIKKGILGKLKRLDYLELFDELQQSKVIQLPQYASR